MNPILCIINKIINFIPLRHNNVVERKEMVTDSILRIELVDDEKWNAYAPTYQEFLPSALQIAGNAIQAHINEKGIKHPEFAWIQTHLVRPSFQHLCFRYGTRIYSILIAIHGIVEKEENDNNNVIVHKRDYDNLLDECHKYNLTPCIVPITYAHSAPMLDGSHLMNGVTNEPILLKTDNDKKNVPMSKWEINNMAINIVIQYLAKQGYDNITYCDVVGIDPQIWFEKDGKKSYVIVRGIPIGHRNNEFEINKNMLIKLSDYDGYFADVQFASSSPILKDEKGNIVPLSKRDSDKDIWMWRGDSFYCNFAGIQEIEKAVTNNEFIKIIEKNSYDIN